MPQLLVETNIQKLELLEGKDGKLPRIRGVASQVDSRNQNGRVYRKGIMERELPKMLKEQNRSDRIGAIDHPDMSPKLGDLALRFVDYSIIGNDVYVDIEILPTTKGRELETLIRNGVEVGLSSRGYGGYEIGDWNGQESAIISDDYRLVTFDAVVEPSVADARISALEQLERIMKIDPERLASLVEKAASAESAHVEPAETQPEAEASTETPVAEEYDEDELALDEAKWTTAYKNSLPNSSFLYVNGKVRKFPVKDADGKVDLPHLRNALARIPDAKGLTADEKAALTKKATALLKAAGGDAKKDEVETEETPTTEAPAAETQPEQTESTDASAATEAEAQDAAPAQAAEGTEVTEAQEAKPLQEKVTELETALTEKVTVLTALQERNTLLKENAASLAALLVALKTAITAELADNDWDDTGMLGMFGQSVAWRRACEVDDEAEDAANIEDESLSRVAQIESLKDAVPALLKEFRTNRIKTTIYEAVRAEQWGRAIASVLEDVCTSVADVPELLPTVKEMVDLRMNRVPQAATTGVVTEQEGQKPAYTGLQNSIRDSLGLPVR